MAGFDGERYLRQVAERWIRESHDPRLPWDPVLPATAAALVAVGAMTAEAARPVIDDYHQALALRDSAYRTRMGSSPARPPASSAPRLGQFRVLPCDRTIDQPWGRLTIDYVAFTEHAMTLDATLSLPEPQPRTRSHPYPAPVPAQANWVTITDDHGVTATARFSVHGRRGDVEWHGSYHPNPRLTADTAWIELLGERIELPATPSAGEVRIETLPAQDPAVRHLWERVATLNDFHDLRRALEATIAALVAAGSLRADDPVLGQARSVLTALRPDQTTGHTTGQTTGQSADHTSPLELDDPPGPWLSLLTRWGQHGGPDGSVPVGALTPPFDGVRAGVIALRSREQMFSIEVELVPDARVGLPYRDLPDRPYLTWWAADDLGNHYLGEHSSYSSGYDWWCGTILFWPALDPRASHVDLMPTATATRAVIRVPLPWTRP